MLIDQFTLVFFNFKICKIVFPNNKKGKILKQNFKNLFFPKAEKQILQKRKQTVKTKNKILKKISKPKKGKIQFNFIIKQILPLANNYR